MRWIVDDALKQGFTDIVLCINRRDEPHFKYEFRDLVLKYSISEEPRGTVDELLCAASLVESTFVLRYGDDLTEVNYKELLRFHRRTKAIATLGVTRELKLPVGIVEKEKDGKVKRFVEKPRLGKLSWVGIAAMEPSILRYFRHGEDIAANTLPRMLAAGESVYCFAMKTPWYDIGNIEHWRRADDYFRNQISVNES